LKKTEFHFSIKGTLLRFPDLQIRKFRLRKLICALKNPIRHLAAQFASLNSPQNVCDEESLNFGRFKAQDMYFFLI
jgi:hypothetical protein